MESNPYDVQFGRRLAHARQAAGLTLQELAERVGWHVSTLHNYESGRRPLKIAQLAQIAAALNRSPAGFLAASEDAISIIEQIDTSPERREQVALFLSHIEEPAGE
jgi:XRE family transcriptional regulator, fatty acid utilization regulator